MDLKAWAKEWGELIGVFADIVSVALTLLALIYTIAGAI